jgi:2-oxoglutarate dehydrogenase E2 component (dihydrolipoamide succinyltransferase)
MQEKKKQAKKVPEAAAPSVDASTEVNEVSKPSPPPQPKVESKPPSPKPSSTPSKPKPTQEQDQPGLIPGSRLERRVKMSRMRLKIAERLKDSQNTAATLTTFNEIDMSNLIDLRAKYKNIVLDTHGVKLGFMSPFIKAASEALKAIPEINARIENNDTIVYNDFTDISVAVATPKGLVTPVLRNCEGMDLVQIEKAMAALGKKAKENAITIEDMAGGTFTISNGGVFGSMMGTPIINQPQSAILGMHATKERAVVVDEAIVIRPMMYVALTYDHRLIDGREAVRFLVKIKEMIEDPRRILLGV